jgi:glycosyltransferase involved in cell wall biosynthesis
MTAPLVSIIVPAYRQAKYLSGAIDCVLRQSYQPLELIVVNDGSDDDTEAVARGYGDRLQYIYQPNRGPSAARNAGIHVARGRYLHFLDADDLLHPDGVAWLVEAMADKEDRICLMGFRKFAHDPASEEQPDFLPPDDRPLARGLIFENLAPPVAHLCSKEMALAIGGFDVKWRHGCEDWDFWLRLALAGAEVVPVPRVGAYYRRHEGAATTYYGRMRSLRGKRLLQAQQEVRDRADLLQRWGLTRAEVRKRHRHLIREALLGAAYSLRKEGDYRGCLGHYARSIWQGGWSLEAVKGLLKLGPQYLLGK